MMQEKLEKVKLIYAERNTSIYNENKEVITMYNEYIKRIVELFDFIMKKDNNLLYTIIFDILVEIGFFSANREFDSDIEVFKELTLKPGMSIINGAGVCRNVACFYDDVFKNLYDYPLKLCCVDINGHQTDDTNIYGNHIINLTLYHDTIYGFDIMNHCLFKAISTDTLDGIWFNYPLVYKPFGDLMIELTTDMEKKSKFYEDFLEKKRLLKIASKKESLTEEEFEKLVYQANEFITSNKIIFQGFIVKNDELTHEIQKKMLLLK